MSIPFVCSHCGKETQVANQHIGESGNCSDCGNPITIRAVPVAQTVTEDIGQDAVVRMLVPVGRSWWAILAGYFGLFSLLCFPGPIAVVLGIIAIWDIKNNPQKHGMVRAIFGLAMGLTGTVVLIVVIIKNFG